MINTIVIPVGIRKTRKKSNWDWGERWAIVDSAGFDVAILDSEFAAIEIALLINNDKSEEYVCDINKQYEYLYKIADDIESKHGRLRFNI